MRLSAADAETGLGSGWISASRSGPIAMRGPLSWLRDDVGTDIDNGCGCACGCSCAVLLRIFCVPHRFICGFDPALEVVSPSPRPPVASGGVICG